MAEANDIFGALNEKYINYVKDEVKTQKEPITPGFTTEFRNELNMIATFAKNERKIFKEIANEEAKQHQLSLKYKNDIYKREQQHYINIYNLKTGLFEKEVKHQEELRDIYKRISEGDRATLGNLAEIYTKRKQIEKVEKESLEYRAKKFEEGVNTFKAGFKKFLTDWANFVTDTMWLNQWKKGLESLGNEYESRFTEIAGRTGSSSRSDTHNIISNLSSTVVNTDYLDKGLNFNADVFPAITEAVKKGFQGEKLEDVAITNAIDKKIMPWLETDSETWVNFQYNLSDDLLRQIKGQQLQLQATQEGNRILQNGVVSALLDELSPTLLNIDANTTDVSKLSTDAQATVAYLMKSGYSQQDAIKIANQAIKAYQNPYDSLTSNNPIEILMGNTSFMGGDLEDILGTYGNIGAMGIGTGPLGMGAIQQVMGVNYGNFTRTDDNAIDLSQLGQGPDWKQIQKDFSINPDAAKQKYIDEQTKLTEHVTATQAYDNNQENWMTNTAMDLNNIAHGIDASKLLLQELVDFKNWLMGIGIALTVDKLTDGVLVKGFAKLFGKLGGGTSGTNVGGSGGILGNLGGKLGSGLIPGAGNIPGAGKLSFMSSGTGAVLGTTAGVTAGALLAKEGINEWQESSAILKDKTASEVQKENAKSGKVASGVAVVGGVAGAAGILALGASNPIGWATLAIGGAALAIKKYNDHLAELDDATSHITKNFEDSKQAIESEAKTREDQLFAIQDNIDSLKTTDEKLQYLQKNGIETTSLAYLKNEEDTNKVNKELERYLDNLIAQNSQDAEDAQTLIDDISADFKNQFNDKVDDVKDTLLEKYSAEAIEERLKKEGKSHNKADIWNEQKKALTKLGYTDEETEALYRHFKNGAAGNGELKDFLDAGQVDGKNIGSFEDKIESGNVDASKVNYVLRQAGVNNIELQDADTISRILGTLATDIIYLHNNQKYGREENKVTTNLPLDFTQEKYDNAKANVLAARADSKNILDMAFKNLGHNDAMKDWPNSLQGFRLGTQWLASDGIFYGHAGERVLTKEQNEQYTESLQSSNNVLQSGFQDVVAAIQSQTAQIIDAIASIKFINNSSSTLSMLPEMGNTRVVL